MFGLVPLPISTVILKLLEKVKNKKIFAEKIVFHVIHFVQSSLIFLSFQLSILLVDITLQQIILDKYENCHIPMSKVLLRRMPYSVLKSGKTYLSFQRIKA